MIANRLRAAAARLSANRAGLATQATRLHGFDRPTVWHEFTPLAVEHDAVNLGQGFPGWAAPAFVKQAVADAAAADFNQYTRPAGHPPLVQALARTYGPLLGRELDADTEITVGVGATETMFAAFQGLVNPGDEVVLMEPAYDMYAAQVQMAGGTPVFVPLRLTESPASDSANDRFALDPAELAAALSPRTRAVVLNTPHNPTGKVFSRAELTDIAAVVAAHPSALVLVDEAYERIAFQEHVRFATLPGMWERSLTVFSAGKTFSVTGFKVGWAIGPAELTAPVMLSNQWVQFCVPTPLQHAVATALDVAERPYEGHDSYYAWLAADYRRRRDALVGHLAAAGLAPVVPEGGFFVMADISGVHVPQAFLDEATPACPEMTRDWAFCRWLTQHARVTAIPPSAFYSPANRGLGATLARFAFCKKDEEIEEAGRRLLSLGGGGGVGGM